jgi:hypothetical protein
MKLHGSGHGEGAQYLLELTLPKFCRLSNVRVYRDADNPKELIIWSETSDAAKAREALNGPEIRSAMQEGGIVGPPKIHVIA